MKHEKPESQRSEEDEQGQQNHRRSEETILDDVWCRNIDNQGDDKRQGSP